MEQMEFDFEYINLKDGSKYSNKVRDENWRKSIRHFYHSKLFDKSVNELIEKFKLKNTSINRIKCQLTRLKSYINNKKLELRKDFKDFSKYPWYIDEKDHSLENEFGDKSKWGMIKLNLKDFWTGIDDRLKISDVKRFINKRFQMLIRGWSYEDLWSLDSAFIHWLYEHLLEYKKWLDDPDCVCGYPQEYEKNGTDGFDNWKKEIDKGIKFIEEYYEAANMEGKYDPELEDDNDPDAKMRSMIVEMQKFDEILKWFNEHIRMIWT